MKTLLIFFFTLPFAVLAQQPELDSLGYLFRTFDTTPCSGCPMLKTGDQFPYSHPNADRLNDTTLWEWVEGPEYSILKNLKICCQMTLRKTLKPLLTFNNVFKNVDVEIKRFEIN